MTNEKHIPIVSIVASKSGTGKTTLIEKIIKVLKERGYSIGVLKHDAHKFDIDHEGKDTWRFTKAGADNVVISSSHKLAMVKLLEKELSLEEITSLYKNVDIILVEGYKNNSYPKIEVYRRNLEQELLYRNPCFDQKSFIAIASDCPLNVSIPVLDLNNYLMIADFIEEKFLHLCRNTLEGKEGGSSCWK